MSKLILPNQNDGNVGRKLILPNQSEGKKSLFVSGREITLQDRSAKRDELPRDDTVKYVIAGQSGSGKTSIGKNLGVLVIGRDELIGALAKESPQFSMKIFGEGKVPAKNQPGLAFLYDQYKEVAERGVPGELAALDYRIFAPTTPETDACIGEITKSLSQLAAKYPEGTSLHVSRIIMELPQLAKYRSAILNKDEDMVPLDRIAVEGVNSNGSKRIKRSSDVVGYVWVHEKEHDEKLAARLLTDGFSPESRPYILRERKLSYNNIKKGFARPEDEGIPLHNHFDSPTKDGKVIVQDYDEENIPSIVRNIAATNREMESKAQAVKEKKILVQVNRHLQANEQLQGNILTQVYELLRAKQPAQAYEVMQAYMQMQAQKQVEK